MPVVCTFFGTPSESGSDRISITWLAVYMSLECESQDSREQATTATKSPHCRVVMKGIQVKNMRSFC